MRILPYALVAVLMSGCATAGADAATCDPETLMIDVVAREDADPQLVVVDVLLTNQGGATCTLEGTPTVSITSAVTDEIIGTATATDDAGEPVILQPKSVAFILVQTRKSIEDTATCVGELTNSMRVALPGLEDAAALVTSSPVAKYCDEPSRGTFTVGPLTADPVHVDGVDDFVPLL